MIREFPIGIRELPRYQQGRGNRLGHSTAEYLIRTEEADSSFPVRRLTRAYTVIGISNSKLVSRSIN